jgi:hypothetical protein
MFKLSPLFFYSPHTLFAPIMLSLHASHSRARASSGAAVRAALTLPWTIAEAVLDQVCVCVCVCVRVRVSCAYSPHPPPKLTVAPQTEESDNAVEAEMLARERSAARLSAQASTEVVG